MKQVAGKIKGDLAQYRELAAFAQFGSDLDAKTKATLERGARIVELFKQSQYNPIAVEMQAIILWVMQKGLFDTVTVDKVKTTQNKFVEFIETRKSSLLEKLGKKRMFDEEVEKELMTALEDFKSFNTL
jgi:F-type H+-transporting ATPase subunit alpha